ncbi:unnamed protein product [Gordionus sp. m RMFG-2023]
MLISHCSDKNLHKCVVGFSTLFACFFVAKIFVDNKGITLSRPFSFRKQNTTVQIPNNTKLTKLHMITKIHYSYFKYDIHTTNCRIRYLDPNDKSIWDFINKTMIPLICSKIPALTTIRNGILTVNYNILNKYYKKVNLDFCNYQVILRNYNESNPDDNTKLSVDKIFFINYTLVKDDFVLVKCYNKSGVFYSNTHANGAIDIVSYLKYGPQHLSRFDPMNYSVFSTSVTSNKSNQIKVSIRPNVINNTIRFFKHSPIENRIMSLLMIGIDSTSRLNFIRGLSNTRRYLMSQRNESFTFKGYIKVGDNTFPNLVALLTGKFMEEYPENFGEADFFDNYSFVWKAFKKSKIAYTTAYIEDSPNMATFNYVKKGFYDPPTDFYYRPYSLESNKLFKKRDNCIRDKHEVLALLEYSRDLMISFKSWPYFCLTYTTRLTHDDLNGIKYVDEMLVNYFTDLFKANALENTLIIIFGDHGMRFGGFRETYIGKKYL